MTESTIKRMEQDDGFPIARGANIEAIYKTLADARIILVPENGGGVGIRLRKPAPVSQEVTHSTVASSPSLKKAR